jgi:hypothetical protein
MRPQPAQRGGLARAQRRRAVRGDARRHRCGPDRLAPSDPGPRSRGRPRRRRRQHVPGARQRDGQPGDRGPWLRARRRGGLSRPLPRGCRQRPSRRARAPGLGAGRDGRPPAGQPGGRSPRHRRLGVRVRAADYRADPPVRRGPHRERRRGGRQEPLRCRACLARTHAGRSASRPRRRARGPGQRRRIAHVRAGLRGDPAGAGAAGHRDHGPAGHRRAHRTPGATDANRRLR